MDALQEVEPYNGMTEEQQQNDEGVVERRGVRWWWEGSVAEGEAFAETSDTW
jgi:hypothetical protein